MSVPKSIAIAVLAVGIAAGIGSAATSGVTGYGPAGEAVAQVSGYTITDVRYQLDPVAAGRVASVSFRLSPASARQVRVRLGAVALLPCKPDGGRESCAAGAAAIAVAAIDRLEIIAVA